MGFIRELVFSFFLFGGSDILKEVDYAIMVLDEMREEWYQKPTNYYIKKIEFQQMSYRRWAIREIQTVIRKNKDRHPLDVLEEFAYLMGKQACETTSAEANFIFLTAQDVARDVIDILYGMV